MTQPLLQAADLRGAAGLTTEVVAALVSLVEAMHVRVASLPRLPGAAPPPDTEHSRGLTGLVYETVRGATHVVGGSADALLAWLGSALTGPDPRQPPRAEREALIAALNGLLGDHFAATANILAIPMTLRQAGRELVLERFAMRAKLTAATPRLVVLLHGLCMNDLQWQHAGHDHGAALASELGYTPVYLHYNSGLSVSTNGRILAQQMERLYDAWPMPIERLAMVGHGMGGLVARSAIHHGTLLQRGHLRWPTRVNDLVSLGTPHQGTTPDGARHGVELLLGGSSYAAPLARLGKLRSAGVNDLRLGNVVSGRPDDTTPAPVSLPATSRCYAIAASLGASTGNTKAKLPDDGLVPVASALGRHSAADRRLAFAEEVVVHETGHLDLLSSAEVFGALKRWLS